MVGVEAAKPALPDRRTREKSRPGKKFVPSG
jgi:hypothetical protein